MDVDVTEANEEERTEIHESRNGLLQRLQTFIANKRRKRKPYTFSRFYHHIENLDKRDTEYRAARRAVELCDEAVAIVSQRVSLIDQLNEAERALTELSCYEEMTDEDARELKEMMARLKALSRDRAELRNQIASFDPNLARMAQMEDEASEIAPEMKEAERRQRMFRQDMNYLRGEKSDLEYERETLVKRAQVIQRFMTGVLIFFVACVTIMSISAVASQTQIVVPMSVMTIMVIIITSLLFGFRRRVKYELELNVKKQKKAVGLLNTKSAVFAHYTNFLNFTYKKYRVRNADMLKRHLKEYDHYKHLTRRYDALRKASEETERELEGMLLLYKIPTQAMVLEDFARLFNLDEKRDIYKNAESRKSSAEKTLRMLDDRQAKLWDELAAQNRLEGGAVDRVIAQYIEEAGEIIMK